MAKLTMLTQRISCVAPRIPFTEADRDAARLKIHKYRGWYKLARWCAKPHGLRWCVLMRDQFTCQMCQRLEHNTSLIGADHKILYKGDIILFWAEGNVWTLCKPCHDSAQLRVGNGGQETRSHHCAVCALGGRGKVPDTLTYGPAGEVT